MKKIKATKIIIWIVGLVLLTHFSASIALYFFQDNIIFQHKKLTQDYIFKFDPDPKQEPFQEYFIQTDDGETLNALLFKTKLRSKGLILYFHGNADNLQRWGKYSVDFTRLGYDILMMDYRGYGKSTGKPTERDLYKDALTVLRWSDRLEVAGAGNRKTGLDDIDAHALQALGDAHLLVACHGRARALLAVAQGCVENN